MSVSNGRTMPEAAERAALSLSTSSEGTSAPRERVSGLLDSTLDWLADAAETLQEVADEQHDWGGLLDRIMPAELPDGVWALYNTLERWRAELLAQEFDRPGEPPPRLQYNAVRLARTWLKLAWGLFSERSACGPQCAPSRGCHAPSKWPVAKRTVMRLVPKELSFRTVQPLSRNYEHWLSMLDAHMRAGHAIATMPLCADGVPPEEADAARRALSRSAELAVAGELGDRRPDGSPRL